MSETEYKGIEAVKAHRKRKVGWILMKGTGKYRRIAFEGAFP